MAVLTEVAIYAMHSLFKMNILKVDGLLKFIGILGSDNLVIGIKKIALSVFFIDILEHPAVTV